MYRDGRGVAQDDREALRWWRKAAEQGNAKAQSNLGFMYYQGLGVTQDDREAVRWIRKAAEQGNILAQSLLGRMYSDGRGVVQDDVPAYKWLSIAYVLGNQNTKIFRQMVERKMTVQQIAEAKREANKWLEAYEKRRP